MKINKSLMIFSMLLVLLISLSAVSAADLENASDDIISSDIAADEIISVDNEANEIFTSDSGMTLFLNVTASSTPYNENATIDVSIYDNDTSKDYNGSTVYLYIDGVPITNLTLDSEAKASYVIPAETYEAGSYYAMAVYMEDSNFLFNGALLNIEKVIPVVSVENVTSKSGDIVTIPFNVTDNKGKGISGDVIVTIYWENDSLSKYVEITNGTAKVGFNLSDLIGIFGGNGTFNRGDLFGGNGSIFGGNGTFNISDLLGGNGTFSIGNGTFNMGDLMNGTFSLGNSTFDIGSLLNGTTNITLGNSTFNLGGLFNGTGNGTFDISSLLNMFLGKGDNTFAYLFAPGTYNMTVTYLSSRNYEKATNDTAKLIITPRSILSADDVVMYYKNGTRYVVNLTDTDKKPMANETVIITLNGVSYERVTDENGTASIALNLPSGNYTASAAYGFGHITDSTVENNITILTTVYGDDLVKVFRNESQYYATFLDGQGNPLANGTEVNFNINGVFYTRTVSGNEGKAKLNINLEQGEYIITAINPVTGENAANNITVIAKIINNEDLTMFYRNGSKYTVTLLGNDGKPVGKDQTVTFNINGVFYERKTDESGVASLNLRLQPGNYIVTAMYEGCNVANNITILPVLSAEDITMKYNDGSSFVANLVDGQGKPLSGAKVTFNLNGELHEQTTNSTGQAALKITLMAGEYVITSTYDEASISNKITVKA